MTATRLPPAAASAGAEAEGDHVDAPDVDAADLGHLAALGGGADRLAEPASSGETETPAAVITSAKAQATRRDLENAKGPRTKEPVRNSTERRSEVKASWAMLTMAMEIAEGQQQRGELGRVHHPPHEQTAAGRTPMTNSSGMETRSERYGFSP